MNRDKLIQKFLSANNLANCTLIPINNDASFRKYFRIKDKGLLLMDTPSELGESIESFIKVDGILLGLDLNVPRILAVEPNDGFLLLEDFGENVFSKILSTNNEEGLYKKAIEVIAHIQSSNIHPDLNEYSIEELLKESRLFIDWYLIKHKQIKINPSDILEFESIISALFQSISPAFDTIVLRDYHVDNLFYLGDIRELTIMNYRRNLVAPVGLIDFQDALIGSPSYDLASLIEDVRRPIGLELKESLLNHFLLHTDLDYEETEREISFFSVQRNLKILGIFCRLKYRDKKEDYMKYLNNGIDFLSKHLEDSSMKDLNRWMKKFAPEISPLRINILN